MMNVEVMICGTSARIKGVTYRYVWRHIVTAMEKIRKRKKDVAFKIFREQ
jgi:hypothetical protein